MVHPGQELFVPLTHTGRPGAERVSGDDDDLAAYVTGTADPESLRYLVERPDTRHLDVEFSPVGQIREPGCFVSVRAYPDDSTTVGEHIVVHGRHVGAVRCQGGQGRLQLATDEVGDRVDAFGGQPPDPFGQALAVAQRVGAECPQATVVAFGGRSDDSSTAGTVDLYGKGFASPGCGVD